MPAYTTHGWAIPGSTENYPKPEKVFPCDGVKKCSQCVREISQWNIPEENILWSYDYTRHREETLLKVRDALVNSGLDTTAALWAIIEMQNLGILFRERT